ncbi:MAG: DUF4167 domain-containing protein [Pseudomonadota bacterium]|nr:DUF4167 domain-containing protein [Pseudomonadota bacterium]|tara:strand:- start:494 stop:871 length:378 start_codon:yes stop_codon:yes gene_type:complete
MNINRRRNFRPRQQKNNFRRRNGSMTSNNSISYNNGNSGFNRNSAMNNIHSVEKTMIKFQQLAKDAQSNGDPVLSQNYLQHADHYLRRFNELSAKKEIVSEKQVSNEKYSKDENTTKELKQNSNS